jgi:hypothetical protein
MNEIKEMPASGQFVAIWIYNGRIWSETCMYKGESLYAYSQAEDDFTECRPPTFRYQCDTGTEARYYTA